MWEAIVAAGIVLGIGGAIALGRLGWDLGRWCLRRAGVVASPYLADPTRAPGNLPGEEHLLWNIPIRFRRWGLTDTRIDFAVWLKWHFRGAAQPYQLTFSGGRSPEKVSALRRTDPRTIPVVIRSLKGECPRLTVDRDFPCIDAPKDAARLMDLGAVWGMSGPRIDFPPGTNWLTVELRVGEELVDCSGYVLTVPQPGEDNAGFVLTRQLVRG